MMPCRSALVALLVAAAAAMPCAAQQAPSSPEALPNQPCAGCFAYLVFPAPAEGEVGSNLATRHDPTPVPITAERQSRIGERAPELVASARQ
jgi:hypothetical protein